MDESTRADLANRFRYASSPEDHARVPAYGALSLALANSKVAIDLLYAVRPEQRNSMLIFAGLHDLALLGHEDLTPLYDDLRRGGGVSPDEFAARVFAVVEADPSLLTPYLDRATQTNEVNRSATIQAVLRVLCARGLREVNLVDVGTSAGLNLFADLLQVRSTDDGDPLTLVSESLSGPWPSAPSARVVSRVGLDPNPLDISNADDLRWLRACLWPEDVRRRERVDAVVSHAPNWPQRQILAGTATAVLDEALALAEPGVPTLVLHTWVAAYFEPAEQAAFGKRMRELTATRDIYWLYLEWPRAVPHLGPPEAHEPPPRAGASQIVVTEPGGEPTSWGWSHSHGHWVSLDPSVLGPKA